MIKVLLTDDHNLVRTGIKRLLEDSKQVAIVGEACSGEDSLVLAQGLKPDIILMDVNMPGIGRVEACRRILERNPKQKIIALTIDTEKTFPKRILEIGAKGYLTKKCGVAAIIEAIKIVEAAVSTLCRLLLSSWQCHYYLIINRTPSIHYLVESFR